MTGRAWCAACGADTTPTGARSCDCQPRSELGAVVIAAVRLAGPEATVRDVRTWMRRVAAARRDAS